LTSRANSNRVVVVQAISRPPVPHVVKHGIIPPICSPTESLSPLNRPTRRSDSTSMRFLTLQRYVWASPTMKRVSNRLGSALRLSQPLSGFLADPNSTALFRAATVPGLSPSELSPRRKVCTPLRATCSPVVSHQRAAAPPHSTVRSRFHETPTTEAAVAKIPRQLWVPFSQARKPASRSP